MGLYYFYYSKQACRLASGQLDSSSWPKPHLGAHFINLKQPTHPKATLQRKPFLAEPVRGRRQTKPGVMLPTMSAQEHCVIELTLLTSFCLACMPIMCTC